MPAQRGLFTPVKVGPLELPNRIVMSPMTRIRAGEGCIPSERMVRYYSQRASGGLIITEGTHPSPMGRGYTYPPGLHTEGQAAGWRKVTDAVHFLFQDRFLFTGDHLDWDRNGEQLSASEDYCWYSWPQQAESMRRLADFRFEWVLPGHGQKVHLPAGKMRAQILRLAETMGAG